MSILEFIVLAAVLFTMLVAGHVPARRRLVRWLVGERVARRLRTYDEEVPPTERGEGPPADACFRAALQHLCRRPAQWRALWTGPVLLTVWVADCQLVGHPFTWTVHGVVFALLGASIAGLGGLVTSCAIASGGRNARARVLLSVSLGFVIAMVGVLVQYAPFPEMFLGGFELGDLPAGLGVMKVTSYACLFVLVWSGAPLVARRSRTTRAGAVGAIVLPIVVFGVGVLPCVINEGIHVSPEWWSVGVNLVVVLPALALGGALVAMAGALEECRPRRAPSRSSAA